MQPRYRRASGLLIVSSCCALLSGCEATNREGPPFQPPATSTDAATSVVGDSGAGATPASDAGGGLPGSAADAGGLDAAANLDAGGTSGALDASQQPSGGDASSAGDTGAIAADATSPADASTDAAPALPACTGTPLSVGDHEYTIQSKNGQKYSYILSVPASVDPTRRAPVIVHWHALSSDPEE